jgi:hypothetical protein
MPENGNCRRDHFPPELARLSATATAVLDTHVADGRRCRACGDEWPCDRVQLAEHNLAGL